MRGAASVCFACDYGEYETDCLESTNMEDLANHAQKLLENEHRRLESKDPFCELCLQSARGYACLGSIEDTQFGPVLVCFSDLEHFDGIRVQQMAHVLQLVRAILAALLTPADPKKRKSHG